MTGSTSLSHNELPSGPLSPRSVRFDESMNVVFESEQTREYKDACWYSASDYQAFKESRIRSVRKIMRSRPLYGKVVEQIHGVCQESCEDSPLLLNEHEMEQLSQVYKSKGASSFIGLERVSIKNVALDKRRRRYQMAYLIQWMQEEQASEERIRAQCERISAASKNFAKNIAVAQAA